MIGCIGLFFNFPLCNFNQICSFHISRDRWSDLLRFKEEFNVSCVFCASLCIIVALQDYIPTNRDILHARKATKGISEFTIPINNIPFRFVDVGGQRSQRQKWIQCFDSVTSILFLVSSSEFDQVLVEDR